MPIPPPYIPKVETPNIATMYLQGMMLKKEMEKAEAASVANALATQKLQHEMDMWPTEKALKEAQTLEALQKIQSNQRLDDLAGQLPDLLGGGGGPNPNVASEDQYLYQQGGQQAQGSQMSIPMRYFRAGAILIQGRGSNETAGRWGGQFLEIGKSLSQLSKDEQEMMDKRLQFLSKSLVSGHLHVGSLNDMERKRLEQVGAVDSNGDGYYDIPTDPAVRSAIMSIAGVNDFVPSGYRLSPEYATRGPLNQGQPQYQQQGQYQGQPQYQQQGQYHGQQQSYQPNGPPRMEKFPGTQDPLSDKEQQNFNQWVESWELLQQMKETVDQTGFVKGNLRIPQLAARMGVNIPATSINAARAQLFDAALNKFTLAGQAMIQGIPSNYDVQVLLRSMAEWGVSPELNKARINLWERAIKDAVRYKIAFHRDSNKPIPPEVIRMAKQAGIDVNNPGFKRLDWRDYADDLRAAGITSIYDKESGKVIDISNYKKGEDPMASNPKTTIDFNTMTKEQKDKFMELMGK